MKRASTSVVNISKRFINIILDYIRQVHKKDFEVYKVQDREIVPEFSIICKNINEEAQDILLFMFNEVGFLKRIAYVNEGLAFDKAVTGVISCKTGKLSEVLKHLKSLFTPIVDIDEESLSEVRAFLREASPLKQATKTFVKDATQPVVDPVKDVVKNTAKVVADTGKEVAGAVSQVAGAYIPKSVKTAYADAKDVYNKEKQNSKDNKETPSVIDKAKAAYRSTFNRGNTYKIAREQFSKACEKIIGSVTVATEDMMTQMLLLWFKHPILDGKVKARTAVDSNSKYLEFLSDVMYSDTVKKAVTRSVYLKVLDKLLPDTDSDKGVLSDPISPLPKFDWAAFGKKIDILIEEYKSQAAKELSIQEQNYGKEELSSDMKATIQDKFVAYINVLQQMKVAFCNPGKAQGNDPGAVWVDSAAGMGKTTFINDVLKKLGFNRVDINYTGNTPATVKADGYYDAKDTEYGYIPAKKSTAVPGVSYDIFWTRKFPIIVVDDAPNMLRGLGETGQLLVQAGDIKRINFSQKETISPVTTRAKIVFLSNESIKDVMRGRAQGVERRVKSVSFNFTADQITNSLKFVNTYSDAINQMGLKELVQDTLDLSSEEIDDFVFEMYKYIVVYEAVQTQLAYYIATSNGVPQYSREKKDKPELVPFGIGYGYTFPRMGDFAKKLLETMRYTSSDKKNVLAKYRLPEALSSLTPTLREVTFPGTWDMKKNKKVISNYASAAQLISAIKSKQSDTSRLWEAAKTQFWGDKTEGNPSPDDTPKFNKTKEPSASTSKKSKSDSIDLFKKAEKRLVKSLMGLSSYDDKKINTASDFAEKLPMPIKNKLIKKYTPLFDFWVESHKKSFREIVDMYQKELKKKNS